MYLQALAEHTNKIYYPNIAQDSFEEIPGYSIGYWVSLHTINSYSKYPPLGNFIIPRHGLATSDNNRFLKLWHEVDKNKINPLGTYFTCKKWYPMNKGGKFRKWYGNWDWVINYENDGQEIKEYAIQLYKCASRTIQNTQFYFKESITWSALSSGTIAFRYTPIGAVFGSGAHCAFAENTEVLKYGLALMNSKILDSYLKIVSPSLNTNVEDVRITPYIQQEKNNIVTITDDSISISQQDWDSHETSWDFETNPLLAVDENTYINNINYKIEQHEKETEERICIDRVKPHPENIEWRVEQYKKKWDRMFNQLHENEEELNRQFIEIYGLQDELTPDVPLDEITILQQGEIKITDQYQLTDNNGNIIIDSKGNRLTTSGDVYIDWQDDVIIKQLISYAVGCMMGRYRLDKPGLHIAHPEPTAEEIAPYSYHDRKYEIDDDGILPLMNSDCGFSDNAPLRMADFVRIAFGEETQVENLNYMEQCLGKTLEQYFVKDFWKDHKKMYQNRPIYWLFASKKGTFQVIAYMHRMNAYAVERIRAKYLLPFIEHLEQEIKKLDMRRAELTTKESKQLQTLQKQLDECREYHERLQVVAEQAISFDLDDGVVVNYAKFGDVLQKIK